MESESGAMQRAKIGPRAARGLVWGAVLLFAGGAAAQETPVPLVTRNRVQLNLAGAELIVTAAKERAAAARLKLNIAVVDDGGHLLAFARMDQARPASAATALTKAVTAATFRQATGPLPSAAEPDLLLNLSLQNAAAASGGKLTTLQGGVPILVDGQVIGAVGIGGGTGEQDADIARFAIAEFSRRLKDETTERNASKPVRVAVQRDGDRVEVREAEGVIWLTMDSETGIGGAVIERTGDAWPKTLAVRLRLAGLESFQVKQSRLSLDVAVPSGGGPVREWRDGREDSPLDAASPYWISIRRRDPSDQGEGKGSFELRLPEALFADNPPSIALRWIDFYRN